MSRPLHPSLARAYKNAPDEAAFLYFDESYAVPDAFQSKSFYILTAAQLRFRDLDSTRATLRNIVGGQWWHTTEALRSAEGKDTTEELLRQMQEWADPYFVSVALPLTNAHDPENARRDCLRSLLSHVYRVPQENTLPTGLIFEARREHRDNDRDRNMLKRLRLDGVLPHSVTTAWVSPADECLLWLADLACMAYRRHLTHADKTGSYFTKYMEKITELITIDPHPTK